MAGALGLVALVLAFFMFAFGATRLLLKGTALEDYTFEATVLLGPLLLVLTVSCGGYVMPQSLARGQVWLVLLAGAVLSAGVWVRDRHALGVLLRNNGRRLALVLAAGAWAAAVLLRSFPGNIWTTFFYLLNHEYLNYAELAARLTGQWTPSADDPVPPFLEHHRLIRYGQDIIAAAVALVSGRHPVNVLLPLSVFYRFQYAVALAVVLDRLARGCRNWLVPALLFLDGYLLVETYSFTASYMSSNCTVCVYVVYLAVLVGKPEWFNGRAVVLFVLANVFFLITYPEMLPLVKVLELGQVGLWVLRGQRGCWAPVLAGNLATFALHPVLVCRKAVIAYEQTTGPSGWNCFGDPRQAPWAYLGNAIGLHYAPVPEEPFAGRPGLAAVLGLLVAALLIAGLVALAVKHRQYLAVAGWVVVAVLLHVRPCLQEGGHFYAAVKFLTQTYFVPLAGIATLGSLRPRALRGGTWAGVMAWAAAAGVATVTVYAGLARHEVAYDYPGMRRALAACRAGRPAVVGLVPGQDLLLLRFAAKECGLPLLPLSGGQYAQIRWREAAPPAGWAAPPAHGRAYEGLCVVPAADRRAFAAGGLSVLCGAPGRPYIVLADGWAVEFQRERLLGAFGPDRLCVGRLADPRELEFSPGRWVNPNGEPIPPLLAAGPRLVIRGQVPAWAGFRMPYRFRVALPDLGWEQGVSVATPGPFETALDLPAYAPRRFLTLTLTPGQTFRPHDANPASADLRPFGFLLSSLRTE